MVKKGKMKLSAVSFFKNTRKSRTRTRTEGKWGNYKVMLLNFA